MAPNGGVVRDTFERADTNSKLRILYDQQHEIIQSIKSLKDSDSNIAEHCVTQWQGCDERFKKVERNWYKITGIILFLAAIGPALIQYLVA